MYPNLEAELKRREITRQKIANDFGLAISTVSGRLTGKVDVTLDFAMRLKHRYSIDIPVDVLFRKNISAALDSTDCHPYKPQ